MSTQQAVPRHVSILRFWFKGEIGSENTYCLNDIGVSISLLRKTSELRDRSEEQTFPRHVSVLKIKSR